MRWLFSLVALVFRGDHATDAELLELRYEHAMLRRHAGPLRYEPANRAWFTALSRLIPRRRWAMVFRHARDATGLHRKLAQRKYDTSKQRKPCGARLQDHDSDLHVLVAPSGRSGSDLVLAREPAEDLFSSDPAPDGDNAAELD
jgi:hypothetical protein